MVSAGGADLKTTSERHRLFFAIQPDEAAADRIAHLIEQLRRRHGLMGRPMARDRLHISLNFVGAYPQAPPETDIARARRCAAAVAMAPFVVALNRAESWKARAQARPLVLTGDEGVIGIDLLRGAIHQALAGGGLVTPRAADRVAHLTLLWGRHEIAEPLAEPLSWTVRDVVLLNSPFGEGRHEVLGRWPLVSSA